MLDCYINGSIGHASWNSSPWVVLEYGLGLTSVQFSWVVQSCATLCDPMDCSMPGFPVLHYLLELDQAHVHWFGVMPSNHLVLCHPLILLSSVFPSIRVFSNESALPIRWPNYWSFSFSPSNEYSGLLSFRTDWFDLLALWLYSSTTIWKHYFFGTQSLWFNFHIHIWLLEKP